MKQLSLDNLRTFVSVIELGGYAKAGEFVGRSQPAISLQIKKLESQLERKLFTKVGQRHLPSADGNWLYPKAKELLELNDNIFKSLIPAPLSGRLRLGIPNEFASTLLPGLIGEFSKRYPDVSLEVTSSLSRDLLHPSQRDHFDLILALVNPNEDTEGEVVLEDEIVWVGDATRPLVGDSIPLVLAPDGCMYRSRVIEELKQQTFAWKITYTNADLGGLVAAIQQGLGITALARSSLPQNVSPLNHPKLPKLGRVNICLFNQDTQHPVISKTLAEFITSRLRA
ncbi:LysR family transcriptional regulator [Alteromonas stellipolaris]|jgi:DNA-binding transcriptional LysR family regulator|uniref:LysR family transcriptional regulator n=1 Tax=Alteromonas stellipolaris TaxID=233316 RepID=A0ABN4LRM1_9ALTE|nr:LysR family transcriptional regulator [Alteromonas stellipolaris]ALM89536.1 Transcriptional regulator, LysR [Alteromonas stellipolaris LMG 21856]AMJ75350.1 LysR family transcriptional regulator [Alteromonas stellipolaris]ANB21518.1 LysR family transcriptional regulator [Alteromonas stellipolaris]MDO6536241.1 LysR family transcriptional regulator [Alteromonas stellipolaris]MDO6627776.1 LysR family transcriptional regulator [Alteromonas stellipolaris]